MITIRPFKALRPDPSLAAQVASRPYDVMTRAEAKEEVRGMPNSFLHITRSEIDLPDTVDAYDPEVYQTALSNLKVFLGRNVIFKETKPCYYIYRLTMGEHVQAGLVALSSLKDYAENRIKKHEFTRPEKEKDRITHIEVTGAQTGNVFMTYRAVEEIDQIVENWISNRSANYDFIAEDGIRHELWVVNKDDTIEELTRLFAEKVPATYIADGHHRAASAFKARDSFPGHGNPAKTNFFLTTLFPSNQIRILDYNRLVTDLNGHTPGAFLQLLAERFDVSEASDPKPGQPNEFTLYLDKKWYLLKVRPGSYDPNDPIESLDISILSRQILSPLLNIQDQRTDERIDFVGGIRGTNALEKRVDSGEMAAAFALYPVRPDQLFAIADAGEVMPPKSTWFEPKLRDGLVTYQVIKK